MDGLDWADAPLFEVGKRAAPAAVQTRAPFVSDKPRAEGDATKQGSAAWLQWRNKGLGSSDAAVLLGTSPWKTITQLHQEKRGLWKQEFGWAQRNAMERGQKLEPCVRRLYEAWDGALYPDATEEHKEHPFLRVSYDGVNRDKGRLIEIKCPNKKVHELALMGEVVDYYMPQVQWQLMISGLKEADYITFNGGDSLLEQASREENRDYWKQNMNALGSSRNMARVRVLRDEAMIAELLHRAVRFWQSIESGVELLGWETWRRPEVPITLTSVDPVGQEALEQSRAEIIEHTGVDPLKLVPLVGFDPEVQVAEQTVEQLVADALKAKAELDAADARFEALKELMKKHLGEQEELLVGEARMRWVKRKGAVDYAKVPELKGLNLDSYRKADTRAFEFKRVGE